MKKPLPVPRIRGAVALIPLGGKKGAGLFARVDVVDMPRVRGHHWTVNANNARLNFPKAGEQDARR